MKILCLLIQADVTYPPINRGLPLSLTDASKATIAYWSYSISAGLTYSIISPYWRTLDIQSTEAAIPPPEGLLYFVDAWLSRFGIE